MNLHQEVVCFFYDTEHFWTLRLLVSAVLSLFKRDQERIEDLETRFQNFKSQFDRGLVIQTSMSLISLVGDLGKSLQISFRFLS